MKKTRLCQNTGFKIIPEKKLFSIFLVLMHLFALSFAQTGRDITINGQVRGTDGEVLSSATVSVKGETTTTATDAEGHYSIRISKVPATLIYSYIGYVPQEVPISGGGVKNVSLQKQSAALNDVVVVGYGTQRRKDITGAIASVAAKDITATAATGAAQAIQGKVAGVVITQDSWNPGAEATVRVRGTRSFNASNDPLYVIDGIPIARGLNEVNPSDIESMEILKDASATAIYGSRGANGVILITTKRGKAGKTSVNYDGYSGVQTPLRSLDIMDGPEYAEFVRAAYRNRTNNPYKGATASMEEDRKVNIFTQDPYVLESVLMGYDAAGNYDPSKVRSFNWMDAVMRKGSIQNHQLSVTGGSEKTRVLMSGAYFKNTGIMKGADYLRYSIRLNVDHELNKRIKVGASSMLSSILENVGSGSDLYSRARQQNPLATPYKDDGSLLLNPGNDALAVNPLLDINGGVIDERRRNRIITSLYFEAKLLEGLRYRTNFGYDYRNTREGGFQHSMSSPRNGSSSAAQYSGSLASGFTVENLLFYNKTFKNNHSLGLTLLQSIQTDRLEVNSARVDNIPYNQQLFYNLGSASNNLGVNSGLTESKLLSYMGRLNYSFANKYALTVSVRSDGSSVLASGHKYAYFPSGAFSWRVSNEKFMDKLTFINDLKLRIGYGKTGNSSINPYQTLGSLAITRYVWDETVALAFAPNSIPNPLLKWETTGQVNLGLDFSLIKNRLSGTIDLYRQHTKDLLMSRQLPVVSGFGSILQNIGETKNSGLEISLSTANILSEKGLKWNSGINFSTNKEEIVQLYNGQQSDIGNRWFVGQPLSVHYDLPFDRIWQEADKEEIARYNANGHNYQPGLIKLVDQNGDYKINEADRVILGTTRPKWMGSITNELSYNDFDFSFQFYSTWGQTVVFNKALRLEGRWNAVNVPYWTPQQPGNTTPKPSANWENPPDVGTTYYQDGSFIRLKYVTLGYKLPKSVISQAGLNNVRVYVSAQNPYLYTKFDGLDPEGGIGYTTPSPKTFIAGINVEF